MLLRPMRVLMPLLVLACTADGPASNGVSINPYNGTTAHGYSVLVWTCKGTRSICFTLEIKCQSFLCLPRLGMTPSRLSPITSNDVHVATYRPHGFGKVPATNRTVFSHWRWVDPEALKSISSKEPPYQAFKASEPFAFRRMGVAT